MRNTHSENFFERHSRNIVHWPFFISHYSVSVMATWERASAGSFTLLSLRPHRDNFQKLCICAWLFMSKTHSKKFFSKDTLYAFFPLTVWDQEDSSLWKTVCWMMIYLNDTLLFEFTWQEGKHQVKLARCLLLFQPNDERYFPSWYKQCIFQFNE